MITLNDDCLYQVFKLLPLKEQLIMVGVCERFKEIIIDMIWRVKFRDFSTNSSAAQALSNNEYQQFFSLIVNFLEKLHIADTKDLFYNIFWGRYAWRSELSFYFGFNEFPHLHTLDCADARLHNDFMRLLALRCPKLQVLRVSGDYITGEHIKDLTNLKELYVDNCPLSQVNLNEIVSCLKLTHLHVNNMSVDPAILMQMAELEEFKIYVTSRDLLVRSEDIEKWTVFLRNHGSKIQALKVYHNGHFEVSITVENIISKEHLSLMCNLKNLCLDENILTFAVISSLRELDIGIMLNPSGLLSLLKRNTNLEVLYLGCPLSNLMYPSNIHPLQYFQFILESIVPLRKLISRKLLTIRIVVNNGDAEIFEIFQNYFHEKLQSIAYKSQNVVKIELMEADNSFKEKRAYIEFNFYSDKDKCK